MCLTVLSSSDQIFYKLCLKWDLPCSFIVIFGLWRKIRRKIREIKFCFHCIVYRVHTINIGGHWICWPWSPRRDRFLYYRFLYYNVNMFSTFLLHHLWKESLSTQPNIKNGNLKLWYFVWWPTFTFVVTDCFFFFFWLFYTHLFPFILANLSRISLPNLQLEKFFIEFSRWSANVTLFVNFSEVLSNI